MKRTQKNAIYYAMRENKLKKLEKLGLLQEFYQFNNGKKYLCISCRHFSRPAALI